MSHACIADAFAQHEHLYKQAILTEYDKAAPYIRQQLNGRLK